MIDIFKTILNYWWKWALEGFSITFSKYIFKLTIYSPFFLFVILNYIWDERLKSKKSGKTFSKDLANKWKRVKVSSE